MLFEFIRGEWLPTGSACLSTEYIEVDMLVGWFFLNDHRFPTSPQSSDVVQVSGIMLGLGIPECMRVMPDASLVQHLVQGFNAGEIGIYSAEDHGFGKASGIQMVRRCLVDGIDQNRILSPGLFSVAAISASGAVLTVVTGTGSSEAVFRVANWRIDAGFISPLLCSDDHSMH